MNAGLLTLFSPDSQSSYRTFTIAWPKNSPSLLAIQIVCGPRHRRIVVFVTVCTPLSTAANVDVYYGQPKAVTGKERRP